MNHISIVCRSLEKSLDFYQNVLGFFPLLCIGVHLLQSEDPENMPKITKINPKDNHFSFQCESMATVGEKLEEMQIEYVDQLFFQDPDGMMIEICNCDNLPVTPLAHDVMLSCSFNNKL
ncbi:Metallothiol transferase [Salix suchowensis]|nr:Metallothiol transferase [Salix suchowensis]